MHFPDVGSQKLSAAMQSWFANDWSQHDSPTCPHSSQSPPTQTELFSWHAWPLGPPWPLAEQQV
jgi:hypothetical protein